MGKKERKEKKKEDQMYKSCTHGNDQTSLELASESLLSEYVVDEWSIERASKQGVTSSCRHQYHISQTVSYL